jgi:hypothetical protein
LNIRPHLKFSSLKATTRFYSKGISEEDGLSDETKLRECSIVRRNLLMSIGAKQVLRLRESSGHGPWAGGVVTGVLFSKFWKWPMRKCLKINSRITCHPDNNSAPQNQKKDETWAGKTAG